MTRALLALAALLLAQAACSRKSGAHDVQAHGGESSAPAPEGIPLTDMRGLTLLRVPEPRQEYRWVPAEAMGDEEAQAVLASPVKGLVSRLLAAPGQPKAAGTPLAMVQSPELARLKAEWIGAKARLDRAQADWEREQRLFQAGAGARRDLEAARSEAATARATEEAARLGLEAVGLAPSEAGSTYTLRAPAPGSVAVWKVQQGQGVDAGQELGSFQAARAALARVELSQPVPADWAPGSLCEVRQGGGRTWKARLEGTATTLTADTGRLAFRLRLLEGPLPVPGTPLEARIPFAKGIFLPQAALQQLDGRWGVFIVRSGKAAFRPVQRGPELKDAVLVLGGLTPGETVVAEGAYLLKARGQKSQEGEEGGHGH